MFFLIWFVIAELIWKFLQFILTKKALSLPLGCHLSFLFLTGSFVTTVHHKGCPNFLSTEGWQQNTLQIPHKTQKQSIHYSTRWEHMFACSLTECMEKLSIGYKESISLEELQSETKRLETWGGGDIAFSMWPLFLISVSRQRLRSYHIIIIIIIIIASYF